MEDLEKRAKELVEEEKAQEAIVEASTKNNETAISIQSAPKYRAPDNVVDALLSNSSAIEIAEAKYNELKNQKKIANKMGEVVKKKTNADIETADIKVQDQIVSNKVKKAEQKNKLLQLKNDRIYLKKEQKHRLDMQRKQHLLEKYEDLLLRTCRKKQKGEDGKYHYENDKNGKPIINIPGKFRFFWIRLFDGLISGLNQTADIIGALNKNVLKGALLIFILCLVFVPPFRTWLLSLIGIKF